MADLERAFLRWLCANDLPRRLLIACPHAPVPDVPRDALGLRLTTCVADTPAGLIAQILAVGVPRVEIVPCPVHADGVLSRAREWEALFPGQVSTAGASRRSRWARHGAVLDITDVPLPRRVVLGLGLRDHSPVDLSLDFPARTLAALQVLRAAGRVHLPEVSDKGEPPTPTSPTSDTTGPAVTAPTTAVLGVDLLARGCVACGVCVRACPSGALRMDSSQRESTLVHVRDACRGALYCVDLCPSGALIATGPADAASVLQRPEDTLASVSTTVCPQCGTVHPDTEGDLCPVCAFRGASAFGSHLPPAALALMQRHQEESAGNLRGGAGGRSS